MPAKNMNIKIAWKALTDTAKKPAKAHDTDAGFDLFADEDIVIKPHQTVLIKTGYAIQMTPPSGWNCYALVKDTSGNAYKLKLSTKAGVIDYEYTGNVGVVIKNNNLFKKIKINKGAKIAQLIPTLIPFTEEVEWVDRETERGDKGYGASTGTATEKRVFYVNVNNLSTDEAIKAINKIKDNYHPAQTMDEKENTNKKILTQDTFVPIKEGQNEK